MKRFHRFIAMLLCMVIVLGIASIQVSTLKNSSELVFCLLFGGEILAALALGFRAANVDSKYAEDIRVLSLVLWAIPLASLFMGMFV